MNQTMTEKITTCLEDYFQKDFRRINHAKDVLKQAQILAKELETVDSELLVAVSLLHDVGIKKSERLHGYNNGKTQELYGPELAENLLKQINFPPDKIVKAKEIIGNHHSPSQYDYMELEILKQADALVNRKEEMNKNQI